MRILVLTPYIYNVDYPEHQKNKTGFGIMVAGIIDSFCNQGHEVYVLTHTLCGARDSGSCHIVRHKLIDLMLHARIHRIVNALNELRHAESSIFSRLQFLYYFVDSGYAKRLIRKIQPDIVHIHGLGPGTINYINACKEVRLPFVVTIHGLLQNDPTVSKYDLAVEKRLLSNFGENNIPLTAISCGIKRRLTNTYYGLRSAENVTVITNGTDVSPKPPYRDIKKELGVSSSHKLCLAVGSVCSRKNQIQILRAIALMPHDFRQRVRLIIIGTICSNYPIFANIKELGLEDTTTVTGFIPHEELHNYYAAADLNILASHDEGFGLSIIEGFVYGVPSVTFSDLDAISDLYDEKAMLLCDERTDEAFSKKIRFALEKQWDREAIKEYSKKFSMESMTEKYISVFKQEIAKHNCKKLPV